MEWLGSLRTSSLAWNEARDSFELLLPWKSGFLKLLLGVLGSMIKHAGIFLNISPTNQRAHGIMSTVSSHLGAPGCLILLD